MDVFEAWGHRGIQSWPIVVAVISVQPGQRVKNSTQIIQAVTPGPRKPVGLEYCLHPNSAEFDLLEKANIGVKVMGSDGTSVLRAFVLQFTFDIPGGDKLLNAKG